VPGNDERCPVFDNEKKKNTSYPGKALFPPDFATKRKSAFRGHVVKQGITSSKPFPHKYECHRSAFHYPSGKSSK
jgi:hypothetical protein